MIVIDLVRDVRVIVCICLGRALLWSCPFAFVCDPLCVVCAKGGENSSLIFFCGLGFAVFGNVFDDLSWCGAFG